MDLPMIGGRCEAYGCGAFDFLPIKCNGCQKFFCGHHIILDAHACASSNNDAALEGQRYKGKRCAFDGCQKPTLESVIVDTTNPEHRVVAVCSHCSHAFCATWVVHYYMPPCRPCLVTHNFFLWSHRHCLDHACSMVPPAPTSSQRNPEAHELLSKHFPAKSSTVSTLSSLPRQPTDPKKLARLRAVELMKMRHHALPADPKDRTLSIPHTQRLHLKVIAVDDTPPTEKIFWLRKVWHSSQV